MSLLFQKISLPYSYVWLGDQYKWLYNQCNYFDSNDCNCCHSVESVLTSSVRIFFSSSRLSSFLLSESLLETLWLQLLQSLNLAILIAAKFLLGLLLLLQQMLSSCKRKPGMHSQDANQVRHVVMISFSV